MRATVSLPTRTGDGTERSDTIMIGDTSFDMDMARAAGVGAIGVTWGYHPRHRLEASHTIVEDMASLPAAIDAIWSVMA